ncbi:MAG: PEP-CTERM sorting domain-containing protein [Phycisphaerales bacterium]|nr:PEP-CTERM sorting domain-containing protein [Phycisphaerales bacterium]MCB9841468.1 PEP-CTERM sorting domain-containing protein [Phycisphaeraceae bacterium]
MSNLSNRLQKHFVVCAAAAAAVATTAHAGVVYSGPVSIVIPDDFGGLYMDVVTGATAGAGFAGYDINPYSAGAPGTSFNLWGPTATTWLDIGGGTYNLPAGTAIGAGGTYGRPGGVSIDPQMNLNSDNNYLGFNFINESLAGATNYGWVQLRFGADPGTREIIGYAYEDSGADIGAGVVPAPASMALLALGGLVGRRRR